MKPTVGTMLQVTKAKTNDTDHRRAKSGSKAQCPPVWRPEASGLTRDELRQIVLDTLG
ncbi:hypothetical protein [uncultured Enterovirga sp.]|uniref:hypothetical protein n=1 Tax=uncultured Enterovirga sp. TaxID=2026352 RepID=UPI0035CACB9F